MKEMPCSLKLAYLLVVILFVLNIVSFVKINKVDNSLNSKVETWISNNPENILKSVSSYVSKQQEESQKKQQAQAGENIDKYKEELRDTKYAGVINPSGTKEIVEFFDYNCGYCKMAHKNVNELLKNRKDVKVILRAIPILGEPSVYATKVGEAILLTKPEAYVDYYNNVMDSSARNTEEVAQVVAKIGLKMSDIDKIMEKNKDQIEQAIKSNLDLAQKVGVNGTPAFIVNGNFFPGAVDAKTLEDSLEK